MEASLRSDTAAEDLASHDGCRLPKGVFGFDTAIVCVKSVRHSARRSHLLLRKAHVHKFSLSIVNWRDLVAMTAFRKIERDLRASITLLKLLLLCPRVFHGHGIVELPLELALHLGGRTILLGWVQNVHSLKVKFAHAPHEYLLKVLLHDVFVAVHCVLRALGVSKSLAQRLDLFLIRGADGLQLRLDSAIKLLLVELDLGDFEVFVPCLEDVPHFFDAVLLGLVVKHRLGMLLEVAVPLERLEAAHLHNLHACHRLALTRPERHDLAAQRVFFAHFGFVGELLLELFNFTLLGAKKSITASSLGVTRLLLLLIEATFGLDEFLHCFGAEIQNKLIKTLRKALVVQCLFHLVDGLKLHGRLRLQILHNNAVLGLLNNRLLHGGQLRCNWKAC